MTTVAITGAGGYVGGRLLDEFAATGVTVLPVVGTARPWLPTNQRVADLTGDLADLVAAFEGAEAVVHLAGANEVTFASDPDSALSTTIVAGRHVGEAAHRAGVVRTVFLSTVHVYGAAMAPGAVLDEHTLPAPTAAYAVARLAVEHMLAAVCDELVVLRLTNAVGAPADDRVDRWSLVANDLCRQATEDGVLRLRSSGLQWRDFCALSDACRWIARSCDPYAVRSGTYNAGSGQPTTVLDLAITVQRRAQERLGRPVPLQVPEYSGLAPLPYRVDVTSAQAVGLTCQRSLDDAVEETLTFCATEREEKG